MLLNTITQTISIRLDKHQKALKLLECFLERKRVTVRKVQQLAGLLNFILHGVIVRRPYTRKFYHKIAGKLKQHHHIRVDGEIRAECKMWIEFLSDLSSVSRPFIDFSKES